MPSPDIIEDFSDEEAAMVEQAAQLNRSSSASSVSESSVSSQDVPTVEGESTAPLYACLGPWGCWHSLLSPDESGIVRTACGLLWALHPSRRMHRHIPCAGAGPASQRARSFVKKGVLHFQLVTLGSRLLPALRSDRAVPRQARVCSGSRSAQPFSYCSLAAVFAQTLCFSCLS